MTADYAATAALYIEELDDEQALAASTLVRFLEIVAGPGTGKTRTLVARVLTLIREHGQDPSSVLVFSFTRAACAEVRQRLEDLLPKDEADAVTVTTFHAWALSVLRRFRPRTWPDDFTIADAKDADRIMAGLWGAHGLPKRREAKHVKQTAMRDALTRYAAQGPLVGEDAPADLVTLLDVFGQRLAWEGLATFGQLMPEVLSALKHSNVIDYVRRWRHVLVDEAHDMTPAEAEVVYRLMSSASLTLVHDPRQQVYAWRGATGWPGYEDPDVVVALLQSYRFGMNIAAAANAVQSEIVRSYLVGGQALPEYLQEPVRGYPITEEPDGARWHNVQDNRRHETAAEQALELSEPFGRGNVAVLCRTNQECKAVAFVLGSSAAHVTRAADALEEAIAPALDGARLAVNGSDDHAFGRVWKSDTEAQARKSWLPMRRIKAEAGQRAHLLETWLRLLHSQESVVPSQSWPTPLGMALGWSHKRDMSFAAWCLTYASTGAMDKPPLHLLEACGVADLPLPEALDAWATRADADAFDSAARQNLIQVATIHASKGREWPGVVVLVSDDVRTRFPRDVETHPEDWRCMFVATTRAMQRLEVVGTNEHVARLWPKPKE